MVRAKVTLVDGKIDITDWEGLDSLGTLRQIIEPIIMAAANEIITVVLERCEAHMPLIHGPDSDGFKGPALEEPTAIYVTLPIGVSGDGFEQEVTWLVSLKDVVGDVIDECVSGGSGRIDDVDSMAIATRLRDALRGLAQEIDNLLGPEGEK